MAAGSQERNVEKVAVGRKSEVGENENEDENHEDTGSENSKMEKMRVCLVKKRPVSPQTYCRDY